MRRVLAPHTIHAAPDRTFVAVEYGDGSADVYLSDHHMMVTRVSGEDPWQLLVEGAVAAGWGILPLGCPTCITDEAQRPHLPEGLGDGAVSVSSGAELVAVIRGS